MFLTIILILSLIFLWIYFYDKYKKIREMHVKVQNIPSLKSLPLLGTVFHYMTTMENIFKMDRKIGRKLYPIYKQWSFNILAVMVMDCDDVETILSNVKYIDKGKVYNFFHPWLGTGLLTSTGTKWQKRRKLLTPTFHWNILEDFLEIFNQETGKLVEEINGSIDKPYVNINEILGQFTLNSIKGTAMGCKLETTPTEIENYKKSIYKIGYLFINRLLKAWYYVDWTYNLSFEGREFNRQVNNLHDFTDKIIKKRKQTFLNGQSRNYSTRKRMALLDLLLSAQNNGFDISDEGIREEVDTFMFEGHDTTAVALCYIFFALANNPDAQEKIYGEIVEIMDNQTPTIELLNKLTYTEMCIKECLRLYPSVPQIARDIREDILLPSGHIIPKGAMAAVYIYDIHRNPAIFPNPEKFDPERFSPENTRIRHPFAYIPFSAGPRNCIGQKFAMLELKAVLCGVLRNFRLESVDKPEDIVFIADIILRTKNSIRIKFRSRFI